MWLPLFSLHYCNPIAGNQEPNFPILSCNKTQLSLLDSILIQFGVISIWALAADRLAWCQTHRLGDGGTRARARAAQSYADLHTNAVWLRSRLKQIEAERTGSSDEWYLESDYRFGLEVDYQFVCLICWVPLFVIVRAAVGGMWSNVEWNPNWVKQREMTHWSALIQKWTAWERWGEWFAVNCCSTHTEQVYTKWVDQLCWCLGLLVG